MFNTPISAGAHTIEFSYSNDGSISEGFDAAWIDDLQIVMDCANANDVSQTECEALVALYDSAGGAGWIDQLGWLNDPNVCDWFGVSCDVSNNVTALSLGFNNLAGTIAPALGDLTNLTMLSLRDNQLTGIIPTQLSNLTLLTHLLLRANNLTGTIPSGVSNLSNLEVLHLNLNELTGSIPVEIGSMTTLVELFLYNNNLTGNIPPQLGNLANMTRFPIWPQPV